jgi:glutamine synthetase
VANNTPLPPPTGADVLTLTPEQRAEAGIRHLPRNLAEAIRAMESSDLVRDALGDHVYSWFLRNKRREWARYESHVSQYELEEYLPVL